MNERVALQPRPRAADRNPTGISSSRAGSGHRGARPPHVDDSRPDSVVKCMQSLHSNEAGRAFLRMETEILRRRHESMRPHQPLAAVSKLGASAIMRAWETSSAVGSSFTAKILCI